MLNKKRYFIGIDIGASFIKGGLLDLEELIVKKVVKYPSPISEVKSPDRKHPRFEVNCDLYEQSVRKIIDEFLTLREDVGGIVFCTQMHGMVLVDRNLNQITPFIGWQDDRLNEKMANNKTWFDLLNEKLKNIDLVKTGIKYRSGLMGGTLFWLSENGVLKKNKESKALFLGDYIAAKITNGRQLVHSTNACGSGLYNTEKNKWDEKILNALNINKSYLPEVVPTGSIVGYFKNNGVQIPVYISSGDLQTAILGSQIGLEKERDFCINIGTGSQVSFISNEFNSGNYDIRSYFDDTYLNTITFIPGGRALNTVIGFIEGIGSRIYDKKNVDVWGKLVKLIDSKKDSEGVIADVSYYVNSITQCEGGSFTNILENNWTVENMFFSAVERMADNYLVAYRRMEKSNKKYNIVCAGGLIRKLEKLHYLLEKKFERKISLAKYEEETLAGLFIISLVCSGKFSTAKDASIFLQKNNLKF
jgi:sugar (pentulose or hexulose) kinase